MMMKTARQLVWLLPALLFLLMAAAVPAEAGAKFVIRFNELNSNTHPMFRSDLHFAEVLAKKTNGAVEVKNFPSSQLGKGRDAIESCQMGTLEITQTMTANVSAFVPAFDVFTMPFIFRNREHQYRVMDGQVGKDLLNELKKVRLVGLYYYDAGSRSFYNARRPIRSVEDVRGMKIRVPQSTVMVDTINALGAGAVPVEYAEVYSALQQGVVDGAENAPIAYLHMKHYEVAKYFSQTHHFRTPDVVVMSLSFWEKLGPEYQKAVMEAAREASLYERRLWNDEEEKALEELRAKGVQINDVPDIAPFQTKVKPVWDKYRAKLPKGLLERIAEVK
ncbi:MAG: TRAP transporter substrate-binding protein [Candidatus Methylomirabilales bacterium]